MQRRETDDFTPQEPAVRAPVFGESIAARCQIRDLPRLFRLLRPVDPGWHAICFVREKNRPRSER
jgi:hypothetical protein